MTEVGTAASGRALVGDRGVPAIGAPGRAAFEVPAGPPPRSPSVADHVLSEYSTADLEIRAASVRGLMHRYREQPRQDAFSVAHDRASDTTVVVVADGVGSFARSGEAAAFLVDRLPALYWWHRDWDAAVKAVNAELQEFAEQASAGFEPDEQLANRMASTVVAVAVVTDQGVRRAHTVRSDDSTIWWLAPDGEWCAVSADDDDDASVHTGAVRALPAATPRLHVAEIDFAHGAIFVMTDGVGGPLAGSLEVQETLAAWWQSPPPLFEFGSQVGFARKTHMDDRTVVGMWVRERAQDGPDGLG